MDRQRGIASVHGQRAKADQALMQQKQREAEEFSKRQQQLHQRTEQAQSAARQRDQAAQAEQERMKTTFYFFENLFLLSINAENIFFFSKH